MEEFAGLTDAIYIEHPAGPRGHNINFNLLINDKAAKTKLAFADVDLVDIETYIRDFEQIRNAEFHSGRTLAGFCLLKYVVEFNATNRSTTISGPKGYFTVLTPEASTLLIKKLKLLLGENKVRI